MQSIPLDSCYCGAPFVRRPLRRSCAHGADHSGTSHSAPRRAQLPAGGLPSCSHSASTRRRHFCASAQPETLQTLQKMAVAGSKRDVRLDEVFRQRVGADASLAVGGQSDASTASEQPVPPSAAGEQPGVSTAGQQPISPSASLGEQPGNSSVAAGEEPGCGSTAWRQPVSPSAMSEQSAPADAGLAESGNGQHCNSSAAQKGSGANGSHSAAESRLSKTLELSAVEVCEVHTLPAEVCSRL